MSRGVDGPAVDEPGVDLDQRRPGRELVPRVVGREDPADADHHQVAARAAGHPPHHVGGAVAQRGAGQPPLLRRQLRGGGQAVARQRRVAHDDPRQAALAGQVDRRVRLVRGEVGGELHQHRPRGEAVRAGEAGVDRVEGGQDLAERAGGLEVAQAGRVGRAHVDGDVVREGPQQLERGRVVGRRVLGSRDLRLAQVDAERGPPEQVAPLPAGEPPRGRPRARVVEAEPVDQRPVRREPEDARRRVARLAVRGHRPDLGEAEAQRRPRRGRHRPLVEARRQPHRVREAESHEGLLQPAAAVGRPGEAPQQRRGHPQRPERELVDALGVDAEEEGAHDRAVEAGDHGGQPTPTAAAGIVTAMWSPT